METTMSNTDKDARSAVEDLKQRLEADEKGLSGDQVLKRHTQWGYNEIPEKKTNPVLAFLTYLWGPIPWMIEVAAVLSLIVHHWVDFTIIVILLLFNAVVGFWQAYQADNAVAALRKKLALKSRTLRDGRWQQIEARELVPGDVIRIRAGDIIPADAVLIDGDYMSVDQSALTGESLPAEKSSGDTVYSGSIARQGEMVALVSEIGNRTYFGKTARLVADAKPTSHFQKAVLQIGNYLIYMSLSLVVVLVLVQHFRGAPMLEMVQFALILTVASIPVAMPAVLSVTMAVGAMVLSKLKAIVSHLESVEEMAGMDILCSDKTGTLTQNQLTMGTSVLFGAQSADDLILAAVLASKDENNDAIDAAIIAGLSDESARQPYRQLSFTPFDPKGKRTEARIENRQGQTFKVSKGAPQVILDLAEVDSETRGRAEQAVNDLAGKGYRTLGVARTDNDGLWRFLGVLPLFDPPRQDSAETIALARQHGIQIKMITGDNLAIARETASQLGLGSHIDTADRLFGDNPETETLSDATTRAVEKADGYAQVFPEHKYAIVKALQAHNHIVGMTGDGVNDAPALKQADMGIAVSGATHAARAASDLVLTAPGLSVIIRAVEEARRIFERMNSYAVYRITETIRIMIFVVLAMVLYNFYPITAIMIILLAFLNDVPIMTIAYDNTWLPPKPVKWEMRRVITVSTAMGVTGVLGSLLMLFLGLNWLKLTIPQVQTYIFLKMAVAGHLTLFISRNKHSFLKKPYPAPVMIWSALLTKLAGTLLAAYGFGLITPIHWSEIGVIWAYSIIWAFFTDWIKTIVYRIFNRTKKAGESYRPSTRHDIAFHSHP